MEESQLHGDLTRTGRLDSPKQTDRFVQCASCQPAGDLFVFEHVAADGPGHYASTMHFGSRSDLCMDV